MQWLWSLGSRLLSPLLSPIVTLFAAPLCGLLRRPTLPRLRVGPEASALQDALRQLRHTTPRANFRAFQMQVREVRDALRPVPRALVVKEEPVFVLQLRAQIALREEARRRDACHEKPKRNPEVP